jgi:hypothetical protein
MIARMTGYISTPRNPAALPRHSGSLGWRPARGREIDSEAEDAAPACHAIPSAHISLRFGASWTVIS